MEISELISKAISKYVLLFTPDYHLMIYSAGALTDTTKVLVEYKATHPTFKYVISTMPTGASSVIDPNFMCTIAYEEDEKDLKIFCFGFMSEARESVFKGQNSHF